MRHQCCVDLMEPLQKTVLQFAAQNPVWTKAPAVLKLGARALYGVSVRCNLCLRLFAPHFAGLVLAPFRFARALVQACLPSRWCTDSPNIAELLEPWPVVGRRGPQAYGAKALLSRASNRISFGWMKSFSLPYCISRSTPSSTRSLRYREAACRWAMSFSTRLAMRQ